MKCYHYLPCARRAFAVVLILPFLAACSRNEEVVTVADLPGGERFAVVRAEDRNWGVHILRDGQIDVGTPTPVTIELYKGEGNRETHHFGYSEYEVLPGGILVGRVNARIGDAEFEVSDRWTTMRDVLRMERSVMVMADTSDAFLSGIKFFADSSVARDDFDVFAPGSIYGSTSHLTRNAIGGVDTYTSGGGETWIREDRLPAPLFGLRFNDGASIALLNSRPDGSTISADSFDDAITTVISGQIQTGALGMRLRDGKLRFGYVYPGSEGEVTYRGQAYPDGQELQWRRRYHPVTRETRHQYQIDFRISNHDAIEDFSRSSWRWAWNTLDPAIEFHDIEVARRALIDMLAERVVTRDGRSGIPHFLSAPRGRFARNTMALMGFTGKNIEAANYLLRESLEREGQEAAMLRRRGEAIIDSFVRIVDMSPPAGDGFDITVGEATVPLHRENILYLRSLSDGFKSLMQAIEREDALGIQHPDWLEWAKTFGNWLLTQQSGEGGFPRAWRPGTGVVAEPSPHSSYNPIPFLVLLNRMTGESQYLDAAIRAGEFTWNVSQREGRYFIGGTIDNPDVIDKEAGTLSLEAYLALYEETNDKQWLQRAQRAADFSETWIYIWNVPMPTDADPEDIHWKPGISTIGLQLISSGHSLVDQYMAFDTDEYAKLYRYTGDPHYLEVARLLLHNTKTMLALPGREFDLKGPGWQQEHWSVAPHRGYGIHRGWLPWVTTSHLNGIFGIMDFDIELYQKLTRP